MTDRSERAGLRVLVCGGRDYEDKDAIWRGLNALCGDMTDEHPLGDVEVTVIHAGGPARLHLQIDGWAVCNWCSQIWMDPVRALAEAGPDLVLAFPGADPEILSRARASGIPVEGGGERGR